MDDNATPGTVPTSDNTSSDPVTMVGRRETAEAKISRHNNVLAEDEADLDDHWEDPVNIGDEFADHKDAVINTLREFISMWDGRLGTVKETQNRIDLEPGAQPVFQSPYRAGTRHRELEKTEIDRMLAQDIIEPSSSEWASPIFFTLKKDGSLRFCIYYRRLDAMTTRDAYPIPRIDECIDSLGHAKMFSTFDSNSGYWKV